MVPDQKPIGVTGGSPGLTPEIDGAPVTIPGGNDGTDKTKMTIPVGSPKVLSPTADNTLPKVGETKAVPSTDIEPTPAAPSNKQEGAASPGQNEENTKNDDSEEWDYVNAMAEGVAGHDRNITTLQEWLDAEGHRPETEAERKKRERKEKSKRIIAAISDGLSSIGNLISTSQYAPNMYNHDKMSMTKGVNSEIEKSKAEREKKEDKHLNFSLRIGELLGDRAKVLRDIDLQKFQRILEKRKMDAYVKGKDKEYEVLGARLKGLNADADRKETQAKNEQQNQDDKHAKTESEIRRNDRTGTGTGRKGGGSSKKGSKKSGTTGTETTIQKRYDKNGKLKGTTETTKIKGNGSGANNNKYPNVSKIFKKK